MTFGQVGKQHAESIKPGAVCNDRQESECMEGKHISDYLADLSRQLNYEYCGGFKSTKNGEFIMGTCGCGYTTDVNKNCNGTHRVVQAVKADIVKDLEANGFAEASAFVKGEKTEK